MPKTKINQPTIMFFNGINNSTINYSDLLAGFMLTSDYTPVLYFFKYNFKNFFRKKKKKTIHKEIQKKTNISQRPLHKTSILDRTEC